MPQTNKPHYRNLCRRKRLKEKRKTWNLLSHIQRRHSLTADQSINAKDWFQCPIRIFVGKRCAHGFTSSKNQETNRYSCTQNVGTRMLQHANLSIGLLAFMKLKTWECVYIHGYLCFYISIQLWTELRFSGIQWMGTVTLLDLISWISVEWISMSQFGVPSLELCLLTFPQSVLLVPYTLKNESSFSLFSI